MRIWGITKKYKGLNWFENFMGGHLSIGNITIYGKNAMHWGVTILTKKYGYICFRLPLRCFGQWYPLYLYFSPNATPWACTFYIGKDKRQKILSAIRFDKFGHNFDTDKFKIELYELNNIQYEL